MRGMILNTILPRIFAILMVSILALTGCTTGGEPTAQGRATSTPFPTAPAVARPTYVVQRGTVQDELSFTGRWQPRDQMALSFPLNGTVRQVNVQRGDLVAAGQLLADYQISELENQLDSALLSLEAAQNGLTSGSEGIVQSVEDAEIALANARLNLENARASRNWTSVASARLNLDNAQRNLDNAQRAYDDAISRPDSSASAVDNAYEQLQSARSNLQSAWNQYYSAAQSYNNEEFNIKQQENAVLRAELELERARAGGGDTNAVQTLRSTQLQVDQLRTQIAQSSLYAPIDGVVLEVTIQPGSSVQAYNTVIKIGLPEPREVIASLAFSDTQELSVGLVGVCQVINRPETAVQCAVRQIPLSARDADQTTRIAASLDNVETNQLVEVRMPLEVRENVLWLPPAAIRTFQNRTFVVVETPDGPRSVDITIGLQTTERVEITSGVNEGDVVVGP
jgi:macrolide-specific efflux system membrane fusion protein